MGTHNFAHLFLTSLCIISSVVTNKHEMACEIVKQQACSGASPKSSAKALRLRESYFQRCSTNPGASKPSLGITPMKALIETRWCVISAARRFAPFSAKAKDLKEVSEDLQAERLCGATEFSAASRHPFIVLLFLLKSLSLSLSLPSSSLKAKHLNTIF